MLRVTVQRCPQSIAFRLEGRLAGPWLQELDACWQQTLSNERTQAVLIDLTGVTFVDKNGKAWLAEKRQLGAEFIAADCLTKAIVQEITQESLPSCGLHNANKIEPETNMNAANYAKWTAENVPQQHGRVVVITGGNRGLGLVVARVLAERGASVVLAVRDTENGQKSAARIADDVQGADVAVQQLDLASLDSIRAAAAELLARLPKIDLLINNAGVMHVPRRATADGFELQFGVNHLGHFALTGLLLEKMLHVADSRVVTVSSVGHRIRGSINFEDLQWERSYDRVAAYGQSKLANLMFTYELSRRLLVSNTKTIAVAAHPGNAQTDLYRHWPGWVREFVGALGPVFVQSATMGALPILRAATDPHVLSGDYYGPGGMLEFKGCPIRVESSEQSHDAALQRRLWAVSEELTRVDYSGVLAAAGCADARRPRPFGYEPHWNSQPKLAFQNGANDTQPLECQVGPRF